MVAIIPPPFGASGIELRTTMVLAPSTGLLQETASPTWVSSTSAPPDASSSSVATVGTGDPSTKDRMVAPPPKAPVSASSVVKGVVAPAAYVLFARGVNSVNPAAKVTNSLPPQDVDILPANGTAISATGAGCGY